MGCAAGDLLRRPFFDTFPGLRGTAVEETFSAVLDDGRLRRVRVLLRAAGSLVRDPRLPRLSRARRDRPRRRRPLPRRPAARRRDAPAHRRPGGAALGDRAGRRRRPDPHRQPGVDRPTARSCAAPASSPAGSATTTWPLDARGLRPADHAAIVAGFDRGCRPNRSRAPAGSFDYEYSAQLGSSATLVPAAGHPRRGVAAGRGHPHRHHRAGPRRAGAGLEGRPRRADRPAQPRDPAGA